MSGAEKEVDVIDFLKKNPGPSIVYVQTHGQTEILCESLNTAGFNAHSYHAGMANDVRTEVQEEFMASSKIVVGAQEVLLQCSDAKVYYSDRGYYRFWDGY